jgi:hypothetical protein
MKIFVLIFLFFFSVFSYANSTNLLDLVQKAECLINKVFSKEIANKVAKNKLKKICELNISNDEKVFKLEKYISYLEQKNTFLKPEAKKEDSSDFPEIVVPDVQDGLKPEAKKEGSSDFPEIVVPDVQDGLKPEAKKEGSSDLNSTRVKKIKIKSFGKHKEKKIDSIRKS